MFEGLDDVPWSELYHAYGKASDVPTWLRQVASENEEEQQNGISMLWSNLIHQGSTYLATAYAVPYLLELLADPGVKVKVNIAGLLADVALCWPYEAEKRSGNTASSLYLPPHIPFKDAREEVGKDLTIFVGLLDDEAVEVRMRATYILKLITSPSEELHNLLLLKAKQESDPLARANLVRTLGALSRIGTTDWQAIWSMAQANNDPLLTFCAALTLPRLAREQTPQEAIQLLATVMFH
ncbi:hypothetical protein [Ktedonospora formicarum]|uniref:Uncharacterized protein n=1 Tax=Ktedonospora formicarum TaxID=2778364 RepID=A0A8J3IDX3_9CHLR|nr:hypothetical protein [Ktedonospora formicarum]GHO49539.1 hypothetical protein KSX_77020 [Ktedonospora formicarum]